ncbi:MAG: cobalamin-binding protein [Proteobacteria bacterium]|nr:cobalamin-binding protein [Pseudomonadota bacterium]
MIRPARGCLAISFTLVALSVTPSVGAAPAISTNAPRTRAAAETTRASATVTDDFGRRVTVRYPPGRIVSLAPGATEMLIAAGAGRQIVATIQYSGQPASESQLPKIGTVGAVDMERLIAARPDVVVVWPNGNNPAEIAAIERLGIPVYRQEADSLQDIGASLRRLGRLTGTSRVADRQAGRLEARLASLRKRYAGASRPPTVLLEVWNRPLYTVGGRELMSDALRVCGARNVFADLPQRAPAIGIGAVLARDPDMIIAVAPPGRGASWLARWSRFPFLRAVRTGRLLAFEDQRLSGLGPGIIDATAALCRKIAALRHRPEAR